MPVPIRPVVKLRTELRWRLLNSHRLSDPYRGLAPSLVVPAGGAVIQSVHVELSPATLQSTLARFLDELLMAPPASSHAEIAKEVVGWRSRFGFDLDLRVGPVQLRELWLPQPGMYSGMSVMIRLFVR